MKSCDATVKSIYYCYFLKPCEFNKIIRHSLIFSVMMKLVLDGSTSQPINGKAIVAMAAVIPLAICTLDLFDAEWNSDRYDVNAEKGPVNLFETFIYSVTVEVLYSTKRVSTFYICQGQNFVS